MVSVSEFSTFDIWVTDYKMLMLEWEAVGSGRGMNIWASFMFEPISLGSLDLLFHLILTVRSDISPFAEEEMNIWRKLLFTLKSKINLFECQAHGGRFVCVCMGGVVGTGFTEWYINTYIKKSQRSREGIKDQWGTSKETEPWQDT